MSQIVLLSEISDLEKIPSSILTESNTKIYSFDIQVHQLLKSKNIEHEVADDLLNQDERLEIFNQLLYFRRWQHETFVDNIEFEGINILKLIDDHEFSTYLMPILINLTLIKKILKKENPSNIVSTTVLEKIITCVINNQNIKGKFFENHIQKNLLWDKISIKYNFGKKPISFNLSKTKYLKLKKIAESTVGLFNEIWLDNNSKKKSIILLEFNTELFSKLLNELKDYDGNIILVNRRRSAIWNKNALNIVKKSKCKILNFEKMITKSQQEKLPLLYEEYSDKLKKFWEKNEIFENLFKIDGLIFWDIIKEDIVKMYERKITSFIELVFVVKNLFEKQDVRCIVSLNNIGETEKAFLEFGKNTPSILLEHGFLERVKKTKRFDETDHVHFKDKLVVWETFRKEWLCNEFNIDSSKIIALGSPRHDDYFIARRKNQNDEKIILLAPNPIGDISGLSRTELKLRVNQVLKEIISIVNKIDKVKIIVKLHPIQLKHNEELKKFFDELPEKIPVFLSTSVIEIINKADAVIIISPEIYGTSTMILESMILGKPTMNIVFSKNICQFNYVLKNAVLTISDDQKITEEVKKLLFDDKLKKNLVKNADEYIKEFMPNPGNASEKFSKIIKSY